MIILNIPLRNHFKVKAVFFLCVYWSIVSIFNGHSLYHHPLQQRNQKLLKHSTTIYFEQSNYVRFQQIKHSNEFGRNHLSVVKFQTFCFSRNTKVAVLAESYCQSWLQVVITLPERTKTGNFFQQSFYELNTMHSHNILYIIYTILEQRNRLSSGFYGALNHSNVNILKFCTLPVSEKSHRKWNKYIYL